MPRTGTFLFACTLLLGLSLSGQTTPQTQPAPGASSSGQPSAQQEAHQKIEELAPDLNLTADQKTKLEPIITGEIQLIHELQADTTMTREQKQQKFHDTMAADHSKIDAILTPEQKQKLQQMNAQRAAERSQGQGQSSSPNAAPTPNPNPKP